MKTNRIILAALAMTGAAAVTLTGCSDERELLGGEGTLAISASIGSDVSVVSRASLSEQELSDKAIIWISNSKGAVRKYTGLSSVPAEGIRLTSGSYVAEAWTGDSVSASFEDRWFKGREEFQIRSNQTTSVELKCRIANTVVSVSYDEKAQQMLHDYTFTIGHKRGTLTFEGNDQRKGYFMMPSYDKNLAWTLTGTLANGETYTRSGVIENAKPATEYAVKVQYSGPTDNPDGGAYFDIAIDEHEVVIEEEVVITLAPQFRGQGFDINEPLFGEVGKLGRRVILVHAVGQIKSMVMNASFLTPVVGASDINLLGMSEAIAQKVKEAGISWSYSYDEAADNSTFKINLEETLLNTLTEGDYDITFTATDSNDKTNSATMKLSATDASVVADEIFLGDVWASRATLTGRVLKSDAANPGFVYRKQGATEWTRVSATVDGTSLSAAITGLEPGTTYEYAATCDPDYISTPATFTTEAATQLPNAGFEDWNTSKTPYLIYASDQSMFWDSGNHGSATMSKNVTVPDETIKHGGARSIKLASQFVGIGVIGKFAAGNVFAGEYLGTEGTDGILGWGRDWTSRPTALKGYVHYTPVAVTHTSLDNVAEGDMDTGIIYIAVLDGSVSKEYNGKNYPIIVKTKTKEFFSKDDPNVIAYGELVLSEATPGSEMVEFTIPLTYFRNNVKAVKLAVVASASRYGDYFTGGNGSTMYLDDLQLVY